MDSTLPESWRVFFWDYDFASLRQEANRECVIGRMLSHGTWDAIAWTRNTYGDAAIREWILRHEGRCLTSEQLRFWELVLDLRSDAVDAWIAVPERKIWEGTSSA